MHLFFSKENSIVDPSPLISRNIYDQSSRPRSASEQEDTIRILLATDNHVGYLERDPVRGDDAVRTFEEIVLLAKEHDVDAMVLSGDLFHENKPSRKSMHQVASILREHCLGDRPCSLELISDPSINFPGQ